MSFSCSRSRSGPSRTRDTGPPSGPSPHTSPESGTPPRARPDCPPTHTPPPPLHRTFWNPRRNDRRKRGPTHKVVAVVTPRPPRRGGTVGPARPAPDVETTVVVTGLEGRLGPVRGGGSGCDVVGGPRGPTGSRWCHPTTLDGVSVVRRVRSTPDQPLGRNHGNSSDTVGRDGTSTPPSR